MFAFCQKLQDITQFSPAEFASFYCIIHASNDILWNMADVQVTTSWRTSKNCICDVLWEIKLGFAKGSNCFYINGIQIKFIAAGKWSR